MKRFVISLFCISLFCISLALSYGSQAIAQNEGGNWTSPRVARFDADTIEEAQQWQKEARASLAAHYKLTDFFKDRDSRKTQAPLNPEVYDTEDYPDYKLLMVNIDVKPGWRSPIYVTIPKKGKGPFPVIFPHVGYKEWAYPETKKVNWGEAHRNRKGTPSADLFARSGVITVGVDLMVADPTAPDFEERRLLSHPAEPPYLRNNPKYRRANSRDKLQLGLRVIDYLKTRPEVDRNRIAFNGGSRWAIFGMDLAAFEPDIRVFVLEVFHIWRSPGVRWDNAFFVEDRVAMVSPRPVRFILGRQDKSQFAPSEKDFALMRKQHRILGGKDEEFQVMWHGGGHDISPEVALEFIKEKLK
jgi:hypothetical protein